MRSRSELVPVDPRLVVMFKLTLGVKLAGGEVVEFTGGTPEPLTSELVIEKIPELGVLVVVFKL